MAIFSASDRTLKYRYIVSEFTITIPPTTIGATSQTITLPSERIGAIGIIHDYDKSLFPILKVSAIIEANLYRVIMKNKNVVKFKVRLQKYSTDESGENKSLLRDSINDQFDLIMDDDYADMDSMLRAEGTKHDLSTPSPSKALNNDDLFAIDNTIDFFLFKSETIQKAKTDINTILPNATVSDAISYFIYKTKMKNFLISPIKNIKTIPELFIPSGKASSALGFIDTYYGFYPTGSLIYFDFKRNYILEYNEKCTAYEEGENQEITILMPVRSSEHASITCSLMKSTGEKIDYIVGNPQTFTPSNDSVSYDMINGSSATVIDTSKGAVSKIEPKVNKKNEVSNRKVFENKTENEWIGETYNAQVKSISVVLNIDLGDFDIDVIAPNKKVNVIFEDSSLSIKYKGSYKISSITHDFSKQGGADLQVASKIVLKKMD